MRMTYLAVIATLVFSASAHAGLLLEPYVGYSIGKATGDLTGAGLPGGLPISIDEGTKGPVFGGRVGMSFLLLGVGIDGTFGTTSGDNVDGKLTAVGPFVSVSLPLIRAWVTYYAKASMDTDNAVTGSPTYEGNGIKGGVGFSLLPLISINAEYYSMQFDEEDSSILDTADITDKGVIIGVSVPLDL
jgi:hypothetical protein